ncbi:MAG: hypothetical protein L0Z73_17300 [Gammaproteobacteria bacterium]|nr:hypothetical protein [Gammaproteobacteria bacterium]
MGHNAFVDRSNRPNYKLHVIIFLAITAISIFLSTLVEKSRDKADIAALKNPVPIDSIGHDENPISQDIKPAIKPPVVARSSISNHSPDTITSPEGDQDYAFDSAPDADNVNALLVENNSNIGEVSAMNATLATVEVADKPAEEQEVMVQADQNQNTGQSGSALSLDQVFQQQNDRFLQTLAKTAEMKPMETAEIKRLREAMRSDRPLSVENHRAVANTSVAATPNAGTKKNETANELANSDQMAFRKTPNTVTQTAQVQHVSQQIAISGTTATIDFGPLLQKAETTIVMTKGELDSVINQFAKSYNEGDINRLMALFADNAITNDQQTKPGIKADYADLFNNTKARKIMINEVKWQFGMDKAEGAAEFVVTVQPINGVMENSYHGQIKITAVKQPKGVYITRLLHELNQ